MGTSYNVVLVVGIRDTLDIQQIRETTARRTVNRCPNNHKPQWISDKFCRECGEAFESVERNTTYTEDFTEKYFTFLERYDPGSSFAVIGTDISGFFDITRSDDEPELVKVDLIADAMLKVRAELKRLEIPGEPQLWHVAWSS